MRAKRSFLSIVVTLVMLAVPAGAGSTPWTCC